jgi:hypothetical protein
MAKLTKAPPLNPVKAPPGIKPPPSKTQDTYTHHTSPNKGPQPVAPEVNAISSKPRATIKQLPDIPGPKYKHDENS